MPVRDNILNAALAAVFPGHTRISPRFALARHSTLDPEVFWATAQRLDDAYVALALRIDWDAVARATLGPEAVAGACRIGVREEGWQCGLALHAEYVRLRDEGHADLAVLREHPTAFDALSWYGPDRVVSAADARYYTLRPDAYHAEEEPPTDVALFAECLREAFLLDDYSAGHGWAYGRVAPRRRDWAALRARLEARNTARAGEGTP